MFRPGGGGSLFDLWPLQDPGSLIREGTLLPYCVSPRTKKTPPFHVSTLCCISQRFCFAHPLCQNFIFTMCQPLHMFIAFVLTLTPTLPGSKTYPSLACNPTLVPIFSPQNSESKSSSGFQSPDAEMLQEGETRAPQAVLFPRPRAAPLPPVGGVHPSN